jgi:hypothetical protein
MKFSQPDQWSVRLFIALCRRYGVRPFRCSRQRSTTIMVRATLREAIHAHTADAETAVEPASLR